MERAGTINIGHLKKTYPIILTLDVVLFIIVFFFFNRFLFILHGYDVSLIDSTSIESFKAYQEIYTSKLPILMTLFILSIICFYWTIRLSKSMNKWMYAFLFLAVGTITFISSVGLFFYFFLPSRLL
jgi:hypothetical protein